MTRESITHPSFGRLTVSRISGKFDNLVGVDFEQGHAIEITLGESSLERDLGRNWWYGGKSIAQVRMTETQFAQFITNIGRGEGTPCTIVYRCTEGFERMPEPPKHMLDLEQLKNETVKPLTELEGLLKVAADVLGDKELMKKAEGRDRAKAAIERARQNITSSLKFYLEQTLETIQEAADKTKLEIEAYAENVVRQYGLDAINAARSAGGALGKSDPSTLIEQKKDG